MTSFECPHCYQQCQYKRKETNTSIAIKTGGAVGGIAAVGGLAAGIIAFGPPTVVIGGVLVTLRLMKPGTKVVKSIVKEIEGYSKDFEEEYWQCMNNDCQKKWIINK